MCTVTIVPRGVDNFILTSNRDEAPERLSSEPAFYNVDDAKLLYPKDELSGGTWVGVSELNRVVCVLNGGFEKHVRKYAYSKSRGVVAKEFMVTNNVCLLVENYNFHGIEPFTMVIVDWEAGLQIFELVWDEKEVHFKQLPNEPKLWSSTTLYSQEMKESRQEWFHNFKSQNELSSSSVLEFHKTAGQGNLDYGVVMDRGFVKTTSITQIIKEGNEVEMQFQNLESHIISSQTFNLPNKVNG
ncbi:NRDE family protein [Gaetbulibacter saemankumensis]|uniref:NRDE family protein n=1 Tax=Gaetbulibacter saemankumensis TaxID=311208 RepID=UPI00041F26AF|nr:NRDE family protein [Gaetbulibacter saemankumensis]